MPTCVTCEAEFGIKFSKLICSKCRQEFCSAHLIEAKHLEISPSLQSSIQQGDGLCYQCIFLVWGKTDEQITSPNGIIGRVTSALIALWEKTKSAFSNEPQKTDLVKILTNSFDDINANRSLAIFRHQKNIEYDFIIQDLTAFSRLFAVSQGRKNEKDFCLNDVYRLIDWVRSHPILPNWAHGISWNTIESSPDGLAYIMDVWHVVGAAMTLANPATGLAWAAYHLGDRAVDQGTGRGIFSNVYDKLKSKLGLNINPSKALVAYLAGLFIIQLLNESTEA